MKILNFGSINKDYVYSVNEFVSPGETIKTNDFKEFLGGKGLNQSVAVSRSGSKIYHAGCINKNDEIIKKQLNEWGVDTSYIYDVDEPTGHAIIQVNTYGENSILIHGGANLKVTSKQIDQIISKFGEDDILIIQNEINKVSEIIDRAYSQKMKIIFNPAPFSKEVLDYPLKKINTLIYNEIEGIGLSGKNNIKDIKMELLEKLPMVNHIITLGEKGSIYFNHNEKISVHAHSVNTIDTTAAGDTYVGYYISTLTKKIGIKECMEKATKAAGITTEKIGGAISIPSID